MHVVSTKQGRVQRQADSACKPCFTTRQPFSTKEHRRFLPFPASTRNNYWIVSAVNYRFVTKSVLVATARAVADLSLYSTGCATTSGRHGRGRGMVPVLLCLPSVWVSGRRLLVQERSIEPVGDDVTAWRCHSNKAFQGPLLWADA